MSVLEAGGDFADGVLAYQGKRLGADFDSKTISEPQTVGSRARLLS